jgi:RHS repeat-associated protein
LKKTFTGPDDVTITYTYDSNNRISGIAIPGQGQITYNTYRWNSPAKVTLPGGSSTEYTYDPLMQVKSIVAKDPGHNPVMTRDYTYSPVGNITSKGTEHGTYTYQYDELYRLTQATNPTLPNEAYTYDLLGNRLTSANTTGSWTYNLNNELGGYDHVSYVYDANGNLTNKTSEANPTNSTNYIYDIGDRLVQVEDGDGIVATYYYDPFGRRLWKDVDGTRTYFLYSDEGLIGEYDSTGNEIKTYGWTPDSIWGTDPLFQKLGDYYYFYQNDHQGTPQKLIGTNGLVVWAGVYDSFGNCQIEVAGITNNLRFAGQYYDEETGLHYSWLRYYDPATGRYLRADPFGVGLNLYDYCFNNPYYWIDPYGLCAVTAVGRGIKSAWDWWSELVAVDPEMLSYPSWLSKETAWWQDFISVTTSHSWLGKGESGTQRTASLDAVGKSIDVQIGWLPGPNELTTEISFGLGRHLGVGFFFTLDDLGQYDRGGLVFHFGLGIGSPINIIGTFPEGVDPFEGTFDPLHP